MLKIANVIVKKRLIICIVFAALVVASVVCIPFVSVNYNDITYLPEDSETSKAIYAMYEDFGAGGNSAVMVSGVNVLAAMEAKSEMEKIEGVASVVWIDDLMANILSGVDENMAPVTITEAQKVSYAMELFYALPDNAAELEFGELLTVLSKNLKISGREDTNVLSRFMLALFSSMGDGFDFDTVSVFKPQLETFFKEGHAFFQVMFLAGDYDKETINAIKEIRKLDYDIAMCGVAATTYNSIQTMNKETGYAMIYAGVVVLIILFLTTSSYWEPVLYLVSIGAAIALNMGSNIILGQISYMTQSVSSVLQLALTMDYSIFILNRFKRERKNGETVENAMTLAIKASLSPVSASSLTTIACFIALMFMKYKMGLDIGIVLAKSVIFSMVSVFFLLPSLIVYTHKLIEKSEHKTFNFTFKRASKNLVKTRFYLPFIVIAIILPTAYFQGLTTFTFGSEASMTSEGTVAYEEKQAIENVFGNQNQFVVMIPKEYGEAEIELSNAYLALSDDGVLSVQSLSLIKESGFDAMLPPNFLSQFSGKANYNRIILNLATGSEGQEADALYQKIKDVTASKLDGLVSQTGKDYYYIGEVSATTEIREIVMSDYNVITYISIALVGIVLLFTFKSIIIPILLLLVIQFSIYVNMSIPYFMGDPLVFIGYLLLSAILLGATIDYAILLTSHYMENRGTMTRFDAARHAMAQSSRALITSAGILTFTGLVLGIFSSMPATALFGMALFRGGIISFLLVMFLLPQLLILLDKPIRYTTWKGKQKMIDNRIADPAPEIIKKDEE